MYKYYYKNNKIYIMDGKKKHRVLKINGKNSIDYINKMQKKY
jgi:hypothetical protein